MLVFSDLYSLRHFIFVFFFMLPTLLNEVKRKKAIEKAIIWVLIKDLALIGLNWIGLDSIKIMIRSSKRSIQLNNVHIWNFFVVASLPLIFVCYFFTENFRLVSSQKSSFSSSLNFNNGIPSSFYFSSGCFLAAYLLSSSLYLPKSQD